MRWLYDLEWRNAVSTRTGASAREFLGQRLLYVERALEWQGVNAWRLLRIDFEDEPGSEPGFSVSTLYLQESNDLTKWVPEDGVWRAILTSVGTQVADNTFLMAGGPTHKDGAVLSGPHSTTVPAGTFETVIAEHEFTSTGQFATEDIFEKRTELDAFDDGPIVVLEAEPNHDFATAPEAVALPAVFAASTHVDDPGLIVADPNVAANLNGVQLLQDFVRFEVTATGTRHIGLVYQRYNAANEHYDDLDLYLFREEVGGAMSLGECAVATRRGRTRRSVPCLSGASVLNCMV